MSNDLVVLSASQNSLSGALPSFDSLKNLQFLDITSNSFSGTLPSAITALDKLEDVMMGMNAFSGFLPVLPVSLVSSSFWGPNTSYSCPFPDYHEVVWL